MGRELKRVPLDFTWPVGQIWKGFINPYRHQECDVCDGSGLNDATKKLDDDWYAFDKDDFIELPNGRRYNNSAWQYHLTEVEVKALIERNRLQEFTRVPLTEEDKKVVEENVKEGKSSLLPYDNSRIPTPEEVNEFFRTGHGHDSCNRWICVEARARHLGVYGECDVCDGSGAIWFSDEIKDKSENFEGYEPPTGDGYQLWETTSEGSPVSPVFDSLEELCEWCAEHATTFANHTTTKEKWMNMLGDGMVSHTEGNMVFI